MHMERMTVKHLSNSKLSSKPFIKIQVDRNRQSTLQVDPKTGKEVLVSKTQSAAERAIIVEDPCVKKVRMLGASLAHVCAFLEDLQLNAMSGKMHKLEVEDRENKGLQIDTNSQLIQTQAPLRPVFVKEDQSCLYLRCGFYRFKDP